MNHPSLRTQLGLCLNELPPDTTITEQVTYALGFRAGCYAFAQAADDECGLQITNISNAYKQLWTLKADIDEIINRIKSSKPYEITED